MQLKKSFLAAAMVAVVGAGALGIGTTLAAQGNEGKVPFGGLAEAIASHFGLDVEEVRTVIEEQHETMHEEQREAMEQKRNEHLAKLVEDGTLTQAQADALKAKQDEMRTLGENLKDKTPEERRTAMQEQRKAFEQWAEEQGIDLKELGPKEFHHRMRGPMKGPMAH